MYILYIQMLSLLKSRFNDTHFNSNTRQDNLRRRKWELKSKQLSLRLSENDYEQIKKRAAHNNKTVSAYMVSGALSPDTGMRCSKEMSDFMQYMNDFTHSMDGILPDPQLKELRKEVAKLWHFLNS